jgi:hypothetical protein
VPLEEANLFAEVRAWGADVVKLETVVQGAVLHTIFDDLSFKALRLEGMVDTFVRYVRTCAPLLEAKKGVEIDSFLILARQADPSSFKDVSDVRNYHRFDLAALEALRTSQTGNPGNKPLTLILHSAFDHNGAFHHDPALTDVLTSTSNHAIMIEGATSLDAISARLPDIVALHGRSEPDPADATKTVKRIDQLMMAGHGSAMSIQLAGDIATDATGQVKTDGGELVTNNDKLDQRVDPTDPDSVARAARTKLFMQQVMGLMSQDPATPHGRIVFNACLTASNEIDPAAVDETASPDDQAAQMKQAIKNAPSLVVAMRQIAADQGRAGLDIKGGNGSFGQVGLMDATGGLDIVADGTDPDGDGLFRTDDAELTNAKKLPYVEHGADPGGCMSAVAECWADDRVALLDAVKKRRAAPRAASWDESVIQAFYELVETRYPTNGAGIALLASVTEGFKELISTTESRVWPIWNLRAGADWQLLFDRLSPEADWTGQPFVPMVFFQGWMFQDPTKMPRFLAALGAMTVRDALDFVYMDALKTIWTQLVPATSTNPPDAGRLRLALRDLFDDATAIQASTRTFLSSLVTSGAFVVDLHTPSDGLVLEDDALRALGLHPSQKAGTTPPSGTASADPPPEGNVDMDGDGENESLVEAMTATGRCKVGSLYVRTQASVRGKPHRRVLHEGDEVHIMGQTTGWYLIDHDGERGYSYKRYIELV